ncbi:MAG: hypothetical protein UDG86_13375 [Lachnospiraceae bacterium]|jgi:hypothetical protein|nr:hypothetical protein [Lachnospiraceae bacterium]
MSENQKKNLIYRCPVCFARENDVILHKKKDDTYYCVKCSFTGTENDIRKMYEDMKKKYRLITRRITIDMLEEF